MSAAEWVPENAGIAELREAAKDCRGCELWQPATQVVFSAGNPHAKMILVGEQPGDVEDREGIPFVGPAGRLLQRALDDAGALRSELYVTNAVKHFRFTVRGKRRIHATPEAAHILACRPWLEAEITQVRPRLIVCLGATAARSLLGSDFRVTKQRGHLIDADPGLGMLRFLATVHPSAILRTRGEEHEQAYAAFVDDLRAAVEASR
jgi:uracil-DNA glycosylase family protein